MTADGDATESTSAIVLTTSSHRDPIRVAVRSAVLTDLALVLSLGAALDPLFQPLLTASDVSNWAESWALMLVLFVPAACFVYRLKGVRTRGRSSARGWAIAGACSCLVCAALSLVAAAAIGLSIGFGGLAGHYSSPTWALAAHKALAMQSALAAAMIVFLFAALAGFAAAVAKR